MRRAIAAGVAVLGIATSAGADPTVKVQRVYLSGAYLAAQVYIRNPGSEFLRTGVECTFLGGGRHVAVGDMNVDPIPPRGERYAEVTAPTRGQQADRAECRLIPEKDEE